RGDMVQIDGSRNGHASLRRRDCRSLVLLVVALVATGCGAAGPPTASPSASLTGGSTTPTVSDSSTGGSTDARTVSTEDTSSAPLGSRSTSSPGSSDGSGSPPPTSVRPSDRG